MPVKFYPEKPIDLLEKYIVKTDGTPLEGEISVYRKLFIDLSSSKDEWYVWHDLKLPTHSDSFNYYQKTSAQLDFLIISKHGIIVLEVKGGPISTKNGEFYYGSNFESKMEQNPFRQAEGYKFTLKDKILNNVKGCLFCEAVIFPHVNKAFDAFIFNDNLLWTEFKATQYLGSLEIFINHVFTYTKTQQEKYKRTYDGINQNTINSIIKILNPTNYDKNKYDNLDTLKWLQIENLEILDGLSKNQRVMIEGPPGSGKTTIAKAYIDQQIGKKGLFLCWNNMLMHYTKRVLKERSNDDSIEVKTLFRFLLSLNSSLSYEYLEKLDAEGFYKELCSTFSILEKGNRLPQYDFIVIDEGQDTFDRGIDIIIDKLCGYNKTGLSTGNALILYDIDQGYRAQNRNLLEISEILIGTFVHFKLNDVKRSAQSSNIKRLAEKSLIEPIELISKKIHENYPQIKILEFNNLEKVKKHIVNNLLSHIRDSGSSIYGKDCILLVDSIFLKGLYNGQPDMNYYLSIENVEPLTKENICDESNVLRFTSILKFKGLEKQRVYLIVPLPSEITKYELYVGITRAISHLEIYFISN